MAKYITPWNCNYNIPVSKPVQQIVQTKSGWQNQESPVASEGNWKQHSQVRGLKQIYTLCFFCKMIERVRVSPGPN